MDRRKKMDISMIASTAITLLGPYLVKSGEKIAEGIGKDIWELIKKPFKSDKEKALLKQLEENPSDQKIQGKIEATLENILEENPVLVDTLKKIVEKAQAQGVSKTTIISNSENVLSDVQIHHIGGDFKIGDGQ
jgi:hypothetical protein